MGRTVQRSSAHTCSSRLNYRLDDTPRSACSAGFKVFCSVVAQLSASSRHSQQAQLAQGPSQLAGPARKIDPAVWPGRHSRIGCGIRRRKSRQQQNSQRFPRHSGATPGAPRRHAAGGGAWEDRAGGGVRARKRLPASPGDVATARPPPRTGLPGRASCVSRRAISGFQRASSSRASCAVAASVAATEGLNSRSNGIRIARTRLRVCA